MPGGDGTGPMGMGSRTGRAAGYCTGNTMSGYANPIPGRGFGYGRGWGGGRGRGRGWRHGFYATGMPGWARSANGTPAFGGWGNPYYATEMSAKEEQQMLSEQAGVIKQQLEDIQSRIETLEKAQAQEN